MNRINKIAFSIFGNLVRKNKDHYKGVRTALKQGHINVPWDIYTSTAYLYSILTAILTSLFCLLLSPLWGYLYVKYLGIAPNMGVSGTGYGESVFILILVLFISFFFAVSTYFLIMAYPGFVSKIRKHKIELTLPHAVSYMHAMSKGGMTLIMIFKSLSQYRNIYGEFAEEIEYIIMDTEMHGKDIVSSLKSAAINTQSDKFRDFLDNIVNTSETSGDLETMFNNMVTHYQETAEVEQSLYLEMLGMLAETYITVFVAGPLFLITIVIVMGLMGPGNLVIIKLLIYAVIPLCAVAFSVLLSTISIGSDSQLIKIYTVTKKIGQYDDVRTRFSNNDERLIRKLLRSLRWTSIVKTRKNPFKLFFADPEKTFCLTIPAAIIFFILSIYNKKIAIDAIDDSIFFSILILLVPFLYFYETQNRRIRAIEDSIPVFLKRMASINDVGMPITDAIKSISKINLGVLSTEIKLMHKDIVWSSNIMNAFTKFERRVRTLSISRIVTLIMKASESTGNIKETLRVAADEASLSDRLRRQKFTVLFSYLIVVYMSFFVFLIVLYVFATMFLTKIPDTSAGGMLSISANKAEFNLLFLHASLIQGFFSGIIAGQMMGASIYDGLKHSIVMIILAYIFFVFLI